ncbi:MAG: tripartite tricarboxylate transporter permease [Alphaproteobacteria bacterium]|nr:tripartite tricarboxylate transporter permease [Alphaproteobacteria bacterium]
MDGILAGLSWLATEQYWFAFLTAVAMAAVAGIMPGISASLLMALAVPFIVFTIRDPVIGIVMLATITGVEEMLDVLPIVVLGHPGGGQVTFLEARPLAAKGQAAHVLGFIYMVSAMGGLIGAIALLLVIPVIKPFILQFSFAEIGAVGLFGVAIVGALSRGAMIKGIMSGAFGLLLSTIGLSVFTGEARYTFDFLHLREGLPLIATAIGLFALPEMFDLMMTRKAISTGSANLSTREVFRGARDALKYWRLIVRHSLLGVFLGAIPGVGSRVVSWLSYGIGVSLSKDRTLFGKGSYEGLIFSESVQSAKEGGQAIPTLALGVPGGQSWVFVLVAMIAYGVSPGPQILSQHGDIVTLIVVSLVLGNALLAMVGMLWSGQLAKLTRVPYPLLGAVIIPLTFLAAFQDTRHWSAIPIVLGFAILGLAMKQFKWPRPPLILGFILGGIIEENLLSAHSLYGTMGILSRPLTVALVVAAVVIAIFFARISASPGPALSEQDSGSAPELAAKDMQADRRWRWTWQNLFPIFFVLVAGYFVWEGLGFRPKAASFPLLLGTAVIILAVAQIVKNGWEDGDGDVMDLGMLSAGVEGRGRSAAILFGLLCMFLVLATIIGLDYAAITLAALSPAALMVGKRPWAWGFLTGGIIAGAVVFVFDDLMHIIWPEPILWTWVQGALF